MLFRSFAGNKDPVSELEKVGRAIVPIRIVVVVSGANDRPMTSAHSIVAHDVEGLAATRFDARPGSAYLVRPDQHVCARWRQVDALSVHAALARATCND